MSGFPDLVKLEFRYHELPAEERPRLLKKLRAKLEGSDDVVFAYVHGSFMERPSFRDLDAAIWIRDASRAFYYTVDFSAEMNVEVGVPVDVQVLNEAPLPFKHYIFTRGKLLFSRDEASRLRLADQVLRQYADLKLLTEMVSRSQT